MSAVVRVSVEIERQRRHLAGVLHSCDGHITQVDVADDVDWSRPRLERDMPSGGCEHRDLVVHAEVDVPGRAGRDIDDGEVDRALDRVDAGNNRRDARIGIVDEHVNRGVPPGYGNVSSPWLVAVLIRRGSIDPLRGLHQNMTAIGEPLADVVAEHLSSNDDLPHAVGTPAGAPAPELGL
ncbi:MAG: hypothetical protein JJE52_12535 [Acidimicrobiia bacterium]|nr:hypothetical protein [Acidimicrobiia bacterium]